MTVSFELDGQEFMALNGGPRSNRAVQAVLRMGRIDIAEVERAAEGG